MQLEIGKNRNDKALEPLERLERAAVALEGLSSNVAKLAGGLTLDGVLATELVTLKDAGMGFGGAGIAQRDSHVKHASVAIHNLGTCTVTVANGGAGNGIATDGRGVVKVRAGMYLCVPFSATSLTIYGRTGEQCVLVRYTRAVPPAAHGGPAPYHTTALTGLVVGQTVGQYATPWGDFAEFGGFTVKDTTGPAGTADVSEFDVLDGNGNVLDTVTLAGAESSDIEYVNGKLASGSTLAVRLNKGSVSGALLVR